MAHHLAHENNNYGEFRDVRYTYDELNRLTKVDDSKQDVFDEMFAYDAQETLSTLPVANIATILAKTGSSPSRTTWAALRTNET